MSPMPALLAIARHESRQLREHPPRLWPLIHQEAHAMRMLLAAHGRFRITAMTLPKNVRVEG